jgi:hypothetical protein
MTPADLTTLANVVAWSIIALTLGATIYVAFGNRENA